MNHVMYNTLRAFWAPVGVLTLDANAAIERSSQGEAETRFALELLEADGMLRQITMCLAGERIMFLATEKGRRQIDSMGVDRV